MQKDSKKFIGRKEEIEQLEKLYKEKQSQMIILYGRRRIGKSFLMNYFCSSKYHFYFTGRKNESQKTLMARFLKELSIFLNDQLIAKISTNDWKEILGIIDAKKTDKKIIIVLDEFQWMCTKGSTILSALQEQWDQKWQNDRNIFLVLCGSIISFMEKNVLSEKSPLYGRRTYSFELEPMQANDAKLFFPKRNFIEQTEIIMTFGGVPSYLEIINNTKSLAQNINELALAKNSFFIAEIDFVLREQLKNPNRYYMLLKSLSKRSMSRKELADELGIGNSGALNLYLQTLLSLHLIKMSVPITKNEISKTQKYMVWDEFSRFYFNFIMPNIDAIKMNDDGEWLYDRMISPFWGSYCGYSFEVFCMKNIKAIISMLGINRVFKRSGSYWHTKNKRRNEGVQIDMVIERSDKITHLIECKWSSGLIGKSIIDELERKKRLYPNPKHHTLKTAIITTHDVTEQVKQAGTIDDVITVKEILESK